MVMSMIIAFAMHTCVCRWMAQHLKIARQQVKWHSPNSTNALFVLYCLRILLFPFFCLCALIHMVQYCTEFHFFSFFDLCSQVRVCCLLPLWWRTTRSLLPAPSSLTQHCIMTYPVLSKRFFLFSVVPPPFFLLLCVVLIYLFYLIYC